MVIDILNLKTPVPCIQGTFGSRLVTYTTQASPKQIMNLLGHDPRSKNWKRLPDDLRQIYEYLQRKTDKNRRESVAAYIEERLGPDSIAVGAFPAISIAFQQPIEFKPYGQPIQSAVGDLMVDISPSAIRVLIDGLGRVTGALDVAEEGNESLLDRFQFPITIYAPSPGTKALSWKEMGQLFHDFNFRVQPVSKQLAIALDTSDIYIALAGKLAECPVIANNGGVAERSASLGSKSTNLVVQTLLVRTVRGACEGRKFQESDMASVDEPNLTKDTFNGLLSSVDTFFSRLANKMGVDRFTDRQSLHLTSPGWQALGVLHHDIVFKLKLDAVEQSKVIDRIAAIDWSRFNPDWLSFGIGHPEIDKKTGSPIVDSSGRQKVALTGAGRTNTQKLLDYMREKASIADRLKPYSLEEAEAA
ncbi:DNA sulfur modification protein DndB [Bradyrhizobium liaoningense]|uniref:DNA sulfur modification protein DndB n=1 Tax=Bradyrhizobium liaoningense TaxID=43992 RepID=UPI001BA57D08|nr:DNA sulfur modification protein DndB [Bradyrhizobium liaoningense]MBR0710976.1 hypothetical protein [Bradyrhizobium liaoningense]